MKEELYKMKTLVTVTGNQFINLISLL